MRIDSINREPQQEERIRRVDPARLEREVIDNAYIIAMTLAGRNDLRLTTGSDGRLKAYSNRVSSVKLK